MGNFLVSCQSEFIPPFKLRTRGLNVLEVLGITASLKIHRWTNEKITNLALVNDNWFNFTLLLVTLNNKIARVELGNSWK